MHLVKKIAVLTYWNSENNYGQILQCFAIVRFINQLGYDAKLLKYVQRPAKTSLIHKAWSLFKLFFIPSKLKEVIHQKIRQRLKLKGAEFDRRFGIFRNKYIPSFEIYHSEELYNNPPKCDAFVCGSDQIWNGTDPIFYLDFVHNSSKKISYAPSLGTFLPNTQQFAYMRKLLSDFDYISVREKKSCNMLIEKGIVSHAEHVPDPTLLLSQDVYTNLASIQSKKSKYILLYLLGNKSKVDFDGLKNFAKLENLEIVYVASQGRMDSYPKENPTIEEWLGLIENAECVVTNSFHGTVFSMIFHKKFCTILLDGFYAATNCRVIELLEKYNLSNHIYTDSFGMLKENLDYSFFDNMRKKECEYVKIKFRDILG